MGEVIADKPTIGDVDLNFFHGLAHGTDAKEVLDQDDFDQDDRVDAGAKKACRPASSWSFVYRLTTLSSPYNLQKGRFFAG